MDLERLEQDVQNAKEVGSISLTVDTKMLHDLLERFKDNSRLLDDALGALREYTVRHAQDITPGQRLWDAVVKDAERLRHILIKVHVITNLNKK